METRERNTLLAGLVVCALIVLVRAPAHAELLVISRYSNSILRYDETNGAYLGVFAGPAVVPSPSGPAVIKPFNGMAFGLDGNLYVAGSHEFLGGVVLRYNGTTGAFIDVFASGVPVGDLAFGPDGNLYVSSYDAGSVLRYNG